MARFDLFGNPDGAGHLLDVQADLLDGLNTRMVVPLLPTAHMPVTIRQLNPVFDVDGEEHVMATQFAAAVPLSILTRKTGSLQAHDTAIIGALDLLLTGV